MNAPQHPIDVRQPDDALARLEFAFNISPTPMLLVDENGRIVLTNRQVEILFEYDAGELTDKLVEVLIPEDVKPHHPDLREAFMQVPAQRFMGTGRDLFGVTKTGRPVPIEIGLHPFSVDDDMHVLVAVLDITERKAGELKIRRALDAASSAMVMVDEEGRITLANALADQMFGYPAGGLLGEAIEQLLPERHRFRHPVYRRGFFLGKTSRSMGVGRSLFALRRDGTEFPVEIGLTPIETSDGHFVMSTINDVTEARAQEREARARNKELSRLNTELTQFAYSASHDLKAPLTSISGLLRFAGEDLEAGDLEEVKSSIHKAGDLAHRLSSRIEDMLTIARADHVKDDTEVVDLAQIVAEVWSDLPDDDGSGEVTLRTDFVLASEFRTNPTMLRGVLENLIGNAKTYRDQTREECFVEVTCREDEDSIVVTVGDNGIGIPERHHGDVFKMFKRFASDRNTGSGLGLALVKKYVDLLAGTIDFESSDAGTTFRVTLPNTPV